jgi:hypothetical protein
VDIWLAGVLLSGGKTNPFIIITQPGNKYYRKPDISIHSLLYYIFITLKSLFQLSSRVELLESVCEEIGSFIEQYRSNLTDTAYSNERSNPGICTAPGL